MQKISALKNRIPSKVFWVGMFITLLLILIFNDVFGDDDHFIVFGLFYFTLLFFAAVRWLFKQTKAVLALRRDKAKMEMLHLKSQVNPHFFFNTLNNLYGLVEKDPKEAQGLILKLSELMRYSIYDGQEEWVALEDEVAYLKNYIGLHENRYHKKVNIEFNVNIKESGLQIMPLMLILLVENAFKHGVEKLRKDAWVKIDLQTEKERILFSVSNNFDPEEVGESDNGIGLTNLKRRLEIGYGKNYNLEISKGENIHEAQLTLKKVRL